MVARGCGYLLSPVGSVSGWGRGWCQKCMGWQGAGVCVWLKRAEENSRVKEPTEKRTGSKNQERTKKRARLKNQQISRAGLKNQERSGRSKRRGRALLKSQEKNQSVVDEQSVIEWPRKEAERG